MIPKIIHYCWFGHSEKASIFYRCYESWLKYASDYKIVEWNEKNFDTNINTYCKEAYNTKKWAFVSDFVRLYVLFYHGGVYLDTDCELTNNIDLFLNNKAFIGYESDCDISTAIIGAEKGHIWIKELLDYYRERHFIKEDTSFDMITNVKIVTDMVKNKYGLILDNKNKNFSDDVNIYPKEYLCRYSDKITNYSIHHFDGSWIDKNVIKREKVLYNNMYLILSKILQLIIEKRNIKALKVIKYKKILLWGIGNVGRGIVEIFRINNIRIDMIIDQQCGIDSYNGIKVENNIDNIVLNDFDIICLTPIKYLKEINNILQEKHYKNQIIDVYSLLKLDEVLY